MRIRSLKMRLQASLPESARDAQQSYINESAEKLLQKSNVSTY